MKNSTADAILINKLRDIFYSGTHAFKCDMEPILELAFLIDEGYLSLDSTNIATKKEYLELAERIGSQRDPHDDAAGGGPTHMALKVLGGNFLKQMRREESRFEQSLCGYFPDILSKSGSVVVECGHTQNPEKILAYFRYGGVQECIQIPYPNVDDDVILGYAFKPQIGLTEFMAAKDQVRRSSMLDILAKRDAKRHQ